ncbi:MAG: ATP phosphoribosyltransferase [Clostridiales bacterium]|nr:ATP phosphoribosyltransferase [Clostridiales bacterium]
MIYVALPKGRLGEKVYNLLSSVGYSCKEYNDANRKLIFKDEENGVAYFWVKPSDVAIYVSQGTADIGVVGKDILEETSPDLYELLDLNIGKCSMCVAAKADFYDDYSKPLKVATKFTNCAKRYFDSIGRETEIIKLNGSIELAPILGMSDVIFDIVETGTTLKHNNLVVLEKVFPISTRLVANKAQYKFKKELILSLCEKLKGVIKL